MRLYDGRRVCSLSAVSLWAALLIVMIAACSGQEEIPEPVATESVPASTGITPAATPALVELVHATPTPYSHSVPAPVVVTATPVPSATPEIATAVSQAAATPTVVAPTVQPSPTQAPTAATELVMSGDWPTPQEIGAIDVGKFRERGYFFKFISNGKRIRVYESPKKTRRVTCGPEIGSAFDNSNPTWSDASHWIWVWREKEGYRPGCSGLSKYEDWANKPLPAAPPDLRDGKTEHLYVKWGEPLKFAVDDSVQDFSLPDWIDAHYVEHSRIAWDDGWAGLCHETSLPWAVWDEKRGFYTISVEDEEAQRQEEWTDERVAMKDEGRKRGLYYIYKGIGRYSLNGPYCWHVPNHEEIPPHWPCLECQLRGP